MPVKSCNKVNQNQRTKYDSVPSKCLEIMFLDIAHQELDCQDGNYKRYHHTDHQDQHLCTGKSKTEFHNLQRAAPNITGIPKKKVNSAATVYGRVPTRIPPMMVEPDLDVPGMTESTWKQPIRKAVLKDKSSRLVHCGSLLLL